VRERERARIARDLHDELGQALTALKLDLLRLSNAPPLPAELGRMVSAVEQMIVSVRRIATDLHPALLDDLGLAATLEWYVGEFERRTGIRCGFRSRGVDEAAIDPDRRTALFRMFQEGLTNVARHSAATRVLATLTMGRAIICLRVRDNGRGRPSGDRAGCGLAGLRARAAAFGGRVAIKCAPGRGTTVSIRVPRAL
jgi:two-component system sensor histidine kinase UhpB